MDPALMAAVIAAFDRASRDGKTTAEALRAGAAVWTQAHRECPAHASVALAAAIVRRERP